MPDDFTRRGLLRASAAAAAGTGMIGTASASESGDDAPTGSGGFDAERIPCLDLSSVEMRTETASAVPERARGIRPGSQMFIEFENGTAGCTANFIWRDTGDGGGPGAADESGNATLPEAAGVPNNGDGALYIGAAGHCFLSADAAASWNAATQEEKENGEAFDVSGLSVSVCSDCTFGGLTGLVVVEGNPIELGDVVYARQEKPNGEDGVGHDFGLVRIPEDKEDMVDPSLPQFGGPDGVSNDAIDAGRLVYQYGAGVANGEVYPTMGRRGVSEGGFGSSNTWYAAMRASPGDSGSPLVASDTSETPPEGGKAGGILTHLTTLGIAGTTMGQCKAMIERDIGLDIEVVQPPDDD